MRTETRASDAIVVNATSPDRSVRARLNGNEVTVEIDPRMLDGHDESSLGEQCSVAVSAALAGGERALAMRAERDGGEEPPEPVDPEYQRLEERFGSELDALVTSARSGPVTVRLRGRTGAGFTLSPRTVRYQGAEQLTRHLNQALNQARREREEPMFDIYTRVFG